MSAPPAPAVHLVVALLAMLSLIGAAEPDDSWVTVNVAWFGQTGGVSQFVGRNRGHMVLYDALGAGVDAVAPLGEGPAVFARRGRLLFHPSELTIGEFRRFLKHGPFVRKALTDSWPVLTSPLEVLFEYPPAPAAPLLALFTEPDPPPLPGLTRVTARMVRFTNAAGDHLHCLELPEVAPDEPLVANPAEWELRFAFRARVRPRWQHARYFFDISVPLNDGARRVAFVEKMRASRESRVLLLGAGNDIEDFSFVVTGKPDLQRPHTWTAFKRLGLDALVPAQKETAFGLEALRREARAAEVPLIAANIAPPAPRPPGIDAEPPGDLAGNEPPLPGWRLVDFEGVQVQIIGLVSSDIDERTRMRGFDGRAVTDPVTAVQRAVQQARRKLGRRPDLVIALGLLSAAEREQLTNESNEVDLLLADFSDHGLAYEQVSNRLLSTPDMPNLRARHRQPLPVVNAGRGRLGLAEIVLYGTVEEGFELFGVTSRAFPLYGGLPADRALLKAVQDTRQRAYAPAQVDLLPDLGDEIIADPVLRERFERDPLVRRLMQIQRDDLSADDPSPRVPGRITADLWRQLVVNVLRERFNGEIALLPRYPFAWELTGPVTLLEACANLNVPDEVAIIYATAAQIRQLTQAPVLAELTLSGLDARAVTVAGRSIDDRERYRVVTSDVLLRDPRIAKLLGGAPRPATRFVERSGEFVVDALGEAEKVRDVTLEVLVTRGLDGDDAGRQQIVGLMHPGGVAAASRWSVDLTDLAFETSLYDVFGRQDAYTNVRETRVTTHSNIALAAQGDAYIRREGESVDWVNHGHLRFAEARYDDGKNQETADELRADTELQLRALSLTGSDGSGVPFGNVAYDSEVTPTEGNPRKRRVEGAMGLLWSGTGVLRAARLAILAGQDFAETDPSVETGFLAALHLTWRLETVEYFLKTEARYYLSDVDRDTDSELGTLITGRAGIDVPVVGGVGVGVFVDLFAYRGKVAATSDPAASVISGLALKYDRRWKPGFESLMGF